MYETSNRNVRKPFLLTQTYTNISFFMKTKNGYIFTFSDKMQFCAVSCFATCDWFCPMTSHIVTKLTCMCIHKIICMADTFIEHCAFDGT